MNLYRCLEAVATTEANGPIDWSAVENAARAVTTPGSLSLDPTEKGAFTEDVKDARTRIQELSGESFDLPNTIEIIHRHHWIEKNLETFERIMTPLEDQPLLLPGVTRRVNTITIAGMLAFLAQHVLGQYDPLLLADTDDHSLYFVKPNIQNVATDLDVEYNRFRRWIIFHELTHAAEFSAAPWLSPYLETHVEALINALADGKFDKTRLQELNTTMTVVEGYAEFIMDRAFDDEYTDLREKINARRQNQGPVNTLIRHLLGISMKRKQYENGRAFFEHITASNSLTTIQVLWEQHENFPTADEIKAPARWESRVLK